MREFSDLDSRDLIDTARGLTGLDRQRPTQANLRRAVSTAYYAVFHSLARSAADLFIGEKDWPGWHQAYRALEHGSAKNACLNKKALLEFPLEIRIFANMFVALQDQRHKADYSLVGNSYDKPSTLAVIDNAEKAIRLLEQVEVQHRRGFVAHVLFKRRLP